jgi:hypothetical protein
MKRLRRAFHAALACLAPVAGAADPAQCRRIDDDAARLACYDEAFKRGQTEPVAEQFTPVDFDKLWINFSGHKGKKVEVEGEISNLADAGFVSFGKQLPGTRTILVDIKELPREVRLRILRTCNRSCAVIVKGAVSAQGENHVVADDVVFKKELTPEERREQGRR